MAEASELAYRSFGINEDSTLHGYYLYAYLPSVAHLSGNYLRQIAWAMETHVLPEFGHRDVCDICRADVQNHFNKLGRTLAPKTLQLVKNIFGAVMNLAEYDEKVQKNPLRSIRLPKLKAPDKEALTVDELRALINASHDLIKPFVILAGCCGLRRGEALGVMRSSIKNGILSVEGQVEHLPGGANYKTDLKTATSYRSIPLPEGLRQALECNQISDIWVVSNTKGGYLFPKNVLRELHIACERAKVKKISPHELRHTFTTIMEAELEAPRSVVMALAGHSAKSVTDRYIHPKMDQLERWMDKLWNQVSTDCRPKQWTTEEKKVG